MKRFYTIIGLSGLLLGAQAQGLDKSSFKQLPSKVEKHTKNINESNTHSNKAAGDLIYGNTMDNAAKWIFSAANVQGEFSHMTTSPANTVTYMGPVATSTAGDGFIGFDGIQYLLAGPVEFQDHTAEFDSVFNFTSFPAVSFKFEQHYRGYNYDVTTVEFSEDGGLTWPHVVTVNDDIAALDYGALSHNLNVSPFIGGKNNVKVRFHWSCPSDDDAYGSGYGWFFDDMKFEEAQSFDVKINSTSFSHNDLYKNQYTMIPLAQASVMKFDAKVENIGASPMTNTVLSATISGAASGSDASTGISLAPLSVMQLETAGAFTPSVTGMYTVDYYVSGDDIDADLSNNSGSTSFEISDDIYAKDDGIYGGFFGASDDDGDLLDDGAEMIAEFELNATMDITGLEVALGAGTTPDLELYYNLYIEDGAGGWTPLFDGASQAIPTAIIADTELSSSGNVNWINLPFPTTQTVDPAVNVTNGGTNTVYAVVGYEFDVAEFVVGQNAPDTSNYITFNGLTASTTYFIGSEPLLRLSSATVVIDVKEEVENIALGQNMPNPTAGTTNIPFTLVNAGEVEFMVTDITGKVIEYSNIGNKASGNHNIEFDGANLADGVYYYSIITNGNKATGKMSIAK